MTDIPEDVMKAATEVVVSLGIGGSANPNPDGFTIRDAIARAILAERERCAKAAEGFLLTPLSPDEEAALATIPEDVAEEAKQAAWLACLNRGVEVSWYRYALAIQAERERCAAVADESRARSLSEDAKGGKLFDYRFAASKAGEIATSIRNPEGYLNDPA